MRDDPDVRAWFRREILPHDDKFCGAAARMLGGAYSRQDVEDLVQETYAKVLAMDNWAAVENPAGFAFRVMRNIMIDAVRHKRVVPITMVDVESLFDIADSACDPETIAISRDELHRFKAIIEELPPQCRRAFTLCKIYGLTHSDIAVRLDISVSTVEKHIVKGLRICGERLGRLPISRSAGIVKQWKPRTSAANE